LAHATQPSFVQSLVVIFAKWIYYQPEAAIQFLESVKVDQQRNGLQLLIQVWTEYAEVFHGSFAIKVR
jgi:hypothetical protein